MLVRGSSAELIKAQMLIFHLCPKIIQVRHGPLKKNGCFILQNTDYYMKNGLFLQVASEKQKQKNSSKPT